MRACPFWTPFGLPLAINRVVWLNDYAFLTRTRLVRTLEEGSLDCSHISSACCASSLSKP